MRGTHTRKRSRPFGGSGRKFKRRRVFKRRGRNSTSFSSATGNVRAITFKGRRMSRKRFRQSLWTQTLHQQHYRTVNAVSITFSAPADSVTMTTTSQQAMRMSSQNFWVAAGGAVVPDSNNTLPTFTGDIIIRGGTIGCRLTNNVDVTNTQVVQGTIYLIHTTKGFSSGNIPATTSLGWDPTLVTDFDTGVGSIVMKKEFLLRDADSVVVEKRVKVKRIDQKDYTLALNQFFWIILLGNVEGAVTHTCTATYYFNMSFAGNAT